MGHLVVAAVVALRVGDIELPLARIAQGDRIRANAEHCPGETLGDHVIGAPLGFIAARGHGDGWRRIGLARAAALQCFFGHLISYHVIFDAMSKYCFSVMPLSFAARFSVAVKAR